MPAIQASRADLNLVLREGESRTATASLGWARHALAVSEVALAMVLLTGAGLMINTILRLQRVNPVFDTTNVVTASLQVPEQGGQFNENSGRRYGKTAAGCRRFLSTTAREGFSVAGIGVSGSHQRSAPPWLGMLLSIANGTVLKRCAIHHTVTSTTGREFLAVAESRDAPFSLLPRSQIVCVSVGRSSRSQLVAQPSRPMK